MMRHRVGAATDNGVARFGRANCLIRTFHLRSSHGSILDNMARMARGRVCATHADRNNRSASCLQDIMKDTSLLGRHLLPQCSLGVPAV
jgi:hypothetical protein